ncbi:GNAT family N-acetyltransferase [Bacillus horti]|uniref:GNAT superfamily N-acetyltransferase n=1 Tax=Caldalkalibacillus horti TaxID=77523 RepID=A0ABT9W4G1_9BACI|nr:GNAT family N-acetyltransferase [Bacillus horti]MDQ0168130.1 GNAT superfamily N-acetyltransferase [Bacillus horti]
MGWYQKLNQYFPEEEMKKKQQLEDLVRRNTNYKKAETEQYILLYGEYEEFVFVDYVLVDKKARGLGIGSHIFEELKEKEKVIVLEVEPVVENDPDTARREQFYLGNGFKKAEDIIYYRDVGETSEELNQMEVYYWSPQGSESMEDIRNYMIIVYEDIHHFQYDDYFDRQTPDPEELVQIEQSDDSQGMEQQPRA